MNFDPSLPRPRAASSVRLEAVSIDRLRGLVRCLDAATLRRAAFPDLATAERELDAQGVRAQAELLLELALALAGDAAASPLASTRSRVARELELARRDLRTVVEALEPFAAAPRAGRVERRPGPSTLPDAWPDPRSLARIAYALAPRASVRAILVRRGWWSGRASRS